MAIRSGALCSFLVPVALLVAAAAEAQASRTWISALGDDAATCGRTDPCRSLSGAFLKTAAGGEISVIDSGSFGNLTITKALTISGDGSLAGILFGFTNGIVVNAGSGDRVVLRNLSLNGAGNGINGIRYLAGRSLTVDGVTISGFTGRGIDMSVTATAKLIVRDTRITGGPLGVLVTSTGGQAQASFEGVHLTGLNTGIEVAANGRAMISDSVLTGNTANGLLASASTSRINVEGCQIAFNDVAGVNAFGNGSFVRLSNNEIYNNANGISISAGATVDTAGNNRLEDNGPSSPPNGTITVQ